MVAFNLAFVLMKLLVLGQHVCQWQRVHDVVVDAYDIAKLLRWRVKGSIDIDLEATTNVLLRMFVHWTCWLPAIVATALSSWCQFFPSIWSWNSSQLANNCMLNPAYIRRIRLCVRWLVPIVLNSLASVGDWMDGGKSGPVGISEMASWEFSTSEMSRRM